MADSRPTCSTCRHYVAFDKKEGACRRYPPKLYILAVLPGKSQGEPPVTPNVSKWPGVTALSWCGEHQPREAVPGAA